MLLFWAVDVCACVVSSYFPRGSSHDWLAFCWLEERTGQDRSQSFKALNEKHMERDRGREWVSGTERERERETRNPAQWKKGSAFTPFRGLTGKERNTQSDIISVTARLLGFQWGDTVKYKNMSSSILRRNSSKKGLEKLQRWEVVDLFVCVWCVCVCVSVCL